MKTQSITIILILFLCFVVISCKDKQNDDGKIYPSQEQKPFLVEDNKGSVYYVDGKWRITVNILNGYKSFYGPEEGGVLFVKNLPTVFQKSGSNVIFSGLVKYLYEEPDYSVGGSIYYFSLDLDKIEIQSTETKSIDMDEKKDNVSKQ